MSQAQAGAVRAVLIRGTGRSFCAGGDNQCFAGGADARAALLKSTLPPLHAAVHTLSMLPSAGDGLGLAFCADITIAAGSMVMRGGYTGIELTPDVGSLWFLVRAEGTAVSVQPTHLAQGQ